MLRTLTGTQTVTSGDLNDTTREQIIKSPDNELFICPITAVLISYDFRAIPFKVLTSAGPKRLLKLLVVLTGIALLLKLSKAVCHPEGESA